jgi:hypothetical protein
LQDEPDLADTLDTLIDYARDCLSCDHAGIHLVRSGGGGMASGEKMKIERNHFLRVAFVGWG